MKDKLLEKILTRENMNAAFKKVKSNKGAGGIDKMEVDELYDYLKENKEWLMERIASGKYKPNPVRRVEIPKDNGKTRPLGIPTVVDRTIQQAITQVLTPIYEEVFSDNSFGFRPGRSAHQAMERCLAYASEGYVWCICMDLESYFDTVNHSKLIQILGEGIKDGRVISLIHKYLNAGVMEDDVRKETPEGVPQGGPLSPLLGNIMLTELDRELERRGHHFVRYADDCLILCKSKRAAERTAESIITFIEEKLFLKVNREKTTIEYIGKVNYLGFGFYNSKDGIKLTVNKKSQKKIKEKVKALTARSNGYSNKGRAVSLKRLIIGWVNYFKIADMKGFLKQLDEWMRRRIRMVLWKQWKKIRTRFTNLKSLGIGEEKAWEFANTRKSYWRTAHSPILSRSLTNKRLERLGFINFYQYYEFVRVN